MVFGMEKSYLWLANPRTLELRVYVNDDEYEAQEVLFCNVEAAQAIMTQQGEVVVPDYDLLVSMWKDNLAGTVPQEGHRVKIDDEVYSIGGVQRLSHGSRFEMRCSRLAGVT